MTDTQETLPGSDSTRSEPPDSGWLWVDNRVLDDHDLSATALAVYVAVCRNVTEGEGWAPRERLADQAGCSTDHVTKALRELEDAGLIGSHPRFADDGGQLPNGYSVADLDAPPLFEKRPPLVSETNEEDITEEDNPPPPARAEEENSSGDSPPCEESDSPPCTADDFEGAFRWMAAVDDGDKAATARELAALVQTYVSEPLPNAEPIEVVDAALTAAYPDAELTDFQRKHLHRELTNVDGESRWRWIVSAVAVAAVLGLDVARVPSVIEGWRAAKDTSRKDSARGDGQAGSPPTIDDDRAPERPTTLEEAKEWAVEQGFSARLGVGLWKAVGSRGWTMTGAIGPQGETIDTLAGWARAHERELLQAARHHSPNT